MRPKHTISVVAAATIIVAGATAAYSYFTAPTRGVGSGRTVAFDHLTNVDLDATVSGRLVPGGTGDLVVRVHNPNGFALTFTVAPDDERPPPPDPDGCSVASVLRVQIPEPQVAARVESTSDVVVTLTDAVEMSVNAPDACQGATFTIPVTLTAEVVR